MNVSEEGAIALSNVKYVPREVVNREERWLQTGDVIFNNTNSPELVGKTAYYGDAGSRAFSNHMTRIRCRLDLLDPHFCALTLHQLWREGYFEAVCNNHVSQSSVSRSVLLETPMPLPPLTEQRRIVAAVEALLERVNGARGRLAKVPAILRRFRQAVLAAACGGRLTERWRDAAEPEKGAELAVGTRESVDNAGLPQVAPSWRWVPLSDLGELARGKSRHRPRNDPRLYGGLYPFIQTGDVARSNGRITSHTQTYNEAGLAQSRLWPAGTVCITIAANIAHSALLAEPACFPDSVVGLLVDSARCMPEYAEFFIRTARNDLSQLAPATAQKNINLEILSEVSVPLPPISEQREIVRTVEPLFAFADAIERRVAAATLRAERLTQAILAKAFRGELVPTEAELARREGRECEAAGVFVEAVGKERELQRRTAGQERPTGVRTRAGRSS